VSIPRPLEPSPVEALAQPHGRFGGGAGPRLLLFAGIGLAWIIPALWNKTFLHAMLLWDGLLLLAFLGDWRRLPRPKLLTLRREWHGPLSIGVGADVKLSVANQSPVDLWVSAYDELPPSNWHMNKAISLNVPAQGARSLNYEYTPGARGDLRTGKVFLRYRSRFRMAERWAVADLRQKVRAYPNFEHARKQSVYLARSRQIELERHMTINGYELFRQQHRIPILLERLAIALALDLGCAVQHRFNAAELDDQIHAALVADPRRAGNVID